MPSAEFRWNERLQRQEIRAIRNIDVGEEITLCYFTIEVMQMPKEDRQTYLEDHYGFTCDCPACSLEGNFMYRYILFYFKKILPDIKGHFCKLNLHLKSQGKNPL